MLHHRLRLSVSVLSGLLALGSALAQPVERTETESIWPDTGYLWRDYGAVMAADGDHLVFSLKNPADGSDGGSVVFMNKAGGVWTEEGHDKKGYGKEKDYKEVRFKEDRQEDRNRSV